MSKDKYPSIFSQSNLGYCVYYPSVLKIGEYPRIFPSFSYLFREANSFPRASLSEKCSLLGTDNDQGKISEHIFAAKLRSKNRFLSYHNFPPPCIDFSWLWKWEKVDHNFFSQCPCKWFSILCSFVTLAKIKEMISTWRNCLGKIISWKNPGARFSKVPKLFG